MNPNLLGAPNIDSSFLERIRTPNMAETIQGGMEGGMRLRDLVRKDRVEGRRRKFEDAFIAASQGQDLTTEEGLRAALKQTAQEFPQESMEIFKAHRSSFPQPKAKTYNIYEGANEKGERQDYQYSDEDPAGTMKPLPVKPYNEPATSKQSYRDIEIPDEALPAWDRSVTWFNAERKRNPSVNQMDLMERFVQEQTTDGISRDAARQIQTKASSRINQVYGTGIRNPWQGTKGYVDAGKAAMEGAELGIVAPGAPKGNADPAKPVAWSKDTRQAIQSIVDKTKQDYNFKEHTESIAGAQKVLEAQALAAETPAALAASITAVARMMAPGVVTDRDFAVLTDYGAPVGVRTWDKVAQWVTGQPPEKKSEIIAGISDILKKAAQRTSGDILNIAYQSAQASGLKVDKDQLWDFIAPSSARQYLNMEESPKASGAPKGKKTADDYLKDAGL